MVLREERQQKISRGIEHPAVVEVAAFKAATTGKSRPLIRPKCSHCQKLGHERHQCYELIGYPPNWQQQRSIRANQVPNHATTTGGGLNRASGIGQPVFPMASLSGRQGGNSVKEQRNIKGQRVLEKPEAVVTRQRGYRVSLNLKLMHCMLSLKKRRTKKAKR